MKKKQRGIAFFELLKHIKFHFCSVFRHNKEFTPNLDFGYDTYTNLMNLMILKWDTTLKNLNKQKYIYESE